MPQEVEEEHDLKEANMSKKAINACKGAKSGRIPYLILKIDSENNTIEVEVES